MNNILCCKFNFQSYDCIIYFLYKEQFLSSSAKNVIIKSHSKKVKTYALNTVAEYILLLVKFDIFSGDRTSS